MQLKKRKKLPRYAVVLQQIGFYCSKKKKKSLVSPGEKEKTLKMNMVINFMLDPKEKTRSEIKEE